MRFDCPECQKPVSVDPRHIGKEANCPYCGKEVEVPMVSGEPPPAEVKLAKGEEIPAVSWTRLPWRESASVANALRAMLVFVGVVIALLLFRIERQLASVPRMADLFTERGELLPHGVGEAESQAPVIHVESELTIEDGAEVTIGNLAEEPVPVKIRE